MDIGDHQSLDALIEQLGVQPVIQIADEPHASKPLPALFEKSREPVVHEPIANGPADVQSKEVHPEPTTSRRVSGFRPKLMPRLLSTGVQPQTFGAGHIPIQNSSKPLPPSTYWDQRNANNLRNLSKAKPGTAEYKQAVKQSAGQFEALMLNELMKQARGTGFGNQSDQSMKSYKEMFDQQITHSISTQGKGFGFATHIENSLMSNAKSIRPQDLDAQRAKLGKISTKSSAEISVSPVYEIQSIEAQQ